MIRLLVFLGAALAASSVWAADKPVYAPPPAWVKPVAIPTTATPPDAGSLQYLLANTQEQLGPDGDKFFTENAARVVSADGLGRVGTFSMQWKPDTDTLIIHRLAIIRAGRTIDLLAGGKTFTVLRRETNLELAMLDGTLTATFQPEGLQVGDIVDFAATVERRDPVLQGRNQGGGQLAFPGIVGHVYFRAVWPAARPMHWTATEGFGKPKLTEANGETELVYDLTDVKTPKPPENAPSRFNDLGIVGVSQFADWAEASALMAPLYDKASTLAPGSPVLAEAEKIKAATADPKARAAQALHLVQSQTHYLFLGMNLGGLVPADADLTWSRRFGDCKGKTALLLALLRALGIQAQPALVSTQRGDGLDARLPMLTYFDHVMVRATIGGKVYWLDGTRTGDQAIDDIDIPNVGWVLPLQAAGGQLEKLTPPPYAHPTIESALDLDSRAGLEKPAPVRAELRYRDDLAIAMHVAVERLSSADADHFQRTFWRERLPWVDVGQVSYAFDEATRSFTLSMTGAGKMDWQDDGGARDFDIADSNLGWDKSYKRDPGPHQDAPFAVAYPMYSARRVVIQLPAGGVGFALFRGQDVDRTIAGVEFKRHSTLANGRVTMDASVRSLEPEFPFAEAEAAAAELRAMTDQDVFVRAGGAYQATLPSADAPSTGDPTTAAEFSIRGLTRLEAGDYDGAISDLGAAIRLEPAVSKHYYNRGVAYFEKGQDDPAVADFTQALRLRPTDVLALLGRGQAYLDKNDQNDADKDFTAAIAASSNNPGVVSEVAEADRGAGRYEAAMAAFDASFAADPPADRRLGLLNARCWVRAEFGRELVKARADCDAAMALKPGNAAVLDSSGLVNLRLRRFDASITDYDAALAIRPRQAESLYGRGLAKLAAGKTGGQDDLAAAKAVDPQVADTFAGFGLKP
jgi:tetratricopeptide (TPR) repeat protein